MFLLFVPLAGAQTAAGPNGAWFTSLSGGDAYISLDCRSNSGAIQTQGAGSYGIFAYSVGGGGGDGGTAAGLPTNPFTNRIKI